MAKGVINLQKESGGIIKISPADGTGVTEVTVPESGELVTKEYVDDTKVSKPELVNITGSATFNGTTQNINLTNIGNITLAIGDVIEVTGTTSNNKLFTVESITDNNNIVVNYEHRGTSTPVPEGRLINETASNCTIKLYNRAKNAPLGQGQYWCKPASGRTNNIPVTNNTNREMSVIAQVSSDNTAGVYLTTEGITIYNATPNIITGDDWCSVTSSIGIGSQYVGGYSGAIAGAVRTFNLYEKR